MINLFSDVYLFVRMTHLFLHINFSHVGPVVLFVPYCSHDVTSAVFTQVYMFKFLELFDLCL